MEKALSLQSMFTDVPFYERFGKARPAGFHLVELGGWTELDLSRVREELSARGLRLYAMTGADRFSLTDPAVREAFHEYLSQSIAVAKSFGCGNLIVRPEGGSFGSAPAQASPADSADFTGRAAAVQTLMEAAGKAERAGVRLLLKPGPASGCAGQYLRTNSSAGSLVKVVNSPALRLLYMIDPARGMEDGAAATFAKYRNQVGHVHVGDGEERTEGAAFLTERLRSIERVLENDFQYGGAIGFDFRAGANEAACLAAITAQLR